MKNTNDGAAIEFELDSDSPPLVPEAVYEAQYIRHEKRRYMNQLKLYVYFEIVTQGKFFGTQLYRAYNHYTPPKPASALVRELALVSGLPRRRKAKFTTDVFKNKVLAIETRTVMSDSKQNQMPPHLWYSVVGAILNVIVSTVFFLLLYSKLNCHLHQYQNHNLNPHLVSKAQVRIIKDEIWAAMSFRQTLLPDSGAPFFLGGAPYRKSKSSLFSGNHT